MKLKKVTVTYEYVIVVDEDSDEHLIARDYLKEALNDHFVYDVDIDIEDYEEGCASDWNDDCIPYGASRDMTIGELSAE